MMDFNVKQMMKDAGAAISRVVQLTEEKLGTSEKTELDAHLENLWERAEMTKNATDKIVRNTEAVLIPNPGNRIEDFIYEKIEKKRPARLSNLEYLGLDMIEAGNEFGPGTAYGATLVKVGQYEQKLGQAERDFIGSAGICFTQPLRRFLDGEMKTIMKEKSLLESKRLDLDACKNRVRKARSQLGHQNKDGLSPEVILEQAERDFRVAQSEFDRQAEITKLLLEGISSSHAAHLRCLQEFVDTQARFYSQCTTIMTDLQKELAGMVKPGPVLRVNSEDLEPPTTKESTFTSIPIASADDSNFSVFLSSMSGAASYPTSLTSQNGIEDGFKKAKVLCDYDAKDATELSLMADEVIFVGEISDDDYLIGRRGERKGKVPKAFLEILEG